ncbi:MAG TPA: TAXI family TRAP transporter solute-binding subunit [Atribacterota bacterium]|nr:TAXI family TRAP transporter solute-binding subunit [Atribacterota bacterium]
MKKLLLICFLLTIFFVITIGANADKYMWNAGTTQEGSTAFVASGILSECINTYAGKDMFMTPIAYTKSLVGLKGFDQKEVVSMYASAQQFEQLINKEGPFSPETYKWSAPYMQLMWAYDQDHFFLIRREDAGKIKSYSDLANKSVFPQMRGTGTYELYQIMLGPSGLNIWDKIVEKTFETAHAGDALKLKQVDVIAAYSGGGEIVGYAQEALARNDLVILTPTPEEMEKIVKVCGFLYPSTVNAEEHFGQDIGLTKTITIPAWSNIYIVDPDVPEEIVYQVVKTAFEHATEMAKSAAVWGKFAEDPWEYNLPFLLKYKKMGVPIHPGALRYFRELGHDTKLLGLE